MKNSWAKKNPFMSRWLSGATRDKKRPRHATAAAKREIKEGASTATTVFVWTRDAHCVAAVRAALEKADWKAASPQPAA